MTTGLVTRPIVSVTVAGATTPTLVNITCSLADHEYSYVLPIGVQGFTIAPRINTGSLKISYTSGESGTIYAEIPRNGFRSQGELGLSAPVTLYFQSPNAGTIVEIESWS